MKPRFVIYALGLVLVILAVMFGWRLLRGTVNSLPASMAKAAHAVSVAPVIAGQGVPTGFPAAVTSPGVSKLLDANDMKMPGGMQRYVDRQNVPIGFYGQVVDQGGNALAGVQIKVVIRHWILANPAVGLVGTKDVTLERLTGADGRFEITSETGDGFDLKYIQKDGYEAEPGRYSYDPASGTLAKPIVFKMWRTDLHEQLITGKKAFHVVPDGRPYVIDLTAGTIAESGEGDLRVWIRYPLQGIRGQLYDWSCEVTVANGGLLEETNRCSAMYVAPVSGYTPSFKFQHQAKYGPPHDTGSRRYYVNLKSGKEYGRIDIELCAPFNNKTPGLIRLSYVVNPSGSRILR